MVVGGIDTATDEAFEGTLKEVVTLEKNTLTPNITPLTTLSAIVYQEEKKTNSNYTLTNAKQTIATNLGLSDVSKIDTDPMSDSEVFIKSQQLVQNTKVLAQAIQGVESNSTKAFTRIMQQVALSVKDDTTTGDFNTTNIINQVESNTSETIDGNISTFLEDHMNSIVTQANNMDESTTFATLQSTLNQRVEEVKEKIAENDFEGLESFVNQDETPEPEPTPEPTPTPTPEPTPNITYNWDISSWGTCSGTCGTNNGIQSRSVSCTASTGGMVADSMCTTVKPATLRNCTASICPAPTPAPAPTNNTPTITSSAIASVNENQTDAITITATDADGDTLTYSLSGTDASSFDIDSSTGVVTFKEAPDYETKTSYTFTANVSDGTASDTQSVTITIINLNDNAPTITSNATASVNENQTDAITITATDADGDSLTYSISGTDASSFNIDSSTGVLAFKTYPEYDYKSSYTLTATASDGTNETNQTLSINILEVATSITDLSSFTLSGDANWSETSGVFTSGDINASQSTCMELNATKNTNLSFDWNVSSESGYDFLRFYINNSEKTKISGTVTTTSLSYPLSQNDILKWCYIKDGSGDSGSDSGSVSNIKLGINNSPKITSTTATVTENQTDAIELNATNANNDTITYSIENNDSESFFIDSGVVTFKVAPTFETKSLYNFTAIANDGVNKTEQNITITVKSEPFTHNSTSYQAIKSPHTGRIWLDRNLGASQVCTALNDTACYGDYYQWGRDADGHEKSNSDTNSTISDTITPNHDQFILDGDNADDDGANYDWVSEDDDGSQRVSKWSSIDGSSICPVGYRVPTGNELLDEKANLQYAFNSFLKIPSAGYHRDTLYGQGSSGAIWSNSVSDDDAFTLSLTIHSSNTIGWTQSYRNIGASVRCIRD